MTQAAPEAPAADQVTDDTAVDPQDAPTTDDPQDTGDQDPRVKRANRQAAEYRTQLRAVEQQLADAQAAQQSNADVLARLAAVFNPEAPADADPAQQLAAITGEAENLRSEVSQLRAELAVHDLAADHDANPKALLDSRTFLNALTGLDPAAEDYRDKVAEAIKDAVSKNATLRATAGQGPRRGGAPGAGQGAAQPDGAVTQEQFNAMGYAQRAQLFQTNPDLYRRLAGS